MPPESALPLPQNPISSADAEPLLSIDEVKQMLGIKSNYTFWNVVRRGNIPHYRLMPNTVRLRRSDVMQWLDQQKATFGTSDSPVPGMLLKTRVCTQSAPHLRAPNRQGKKSGILRIKVGSVSVPIYASKSDGCIRYTVAFYRDGQRIRRTFGDLELAQQEAKLAAEQIHAGLGFTLDLRPSDREAYRSAIHLLESLEVPLVAAVDEYVRCRALLDGKPLLSAVDDYVRRCRNVRTGAMIPDLAKEFFAAKRQDGASKLYMWKLQSDIGRFARAFPVPILHVKSNQIDEWLRSLYSNPRSRNTLHASVGTFFSWAKSRSYLPKNEATEAEAVGKAKVGDTVTEIFTSEQMAKVMAVATPEVLPIFALGAFAGLRVAEITRLDWSAVDLNRQIIQVRADQAKTASRRIVPVSDNLKEWLAPHVGTGKIVKFSPIYLKVTPLTRMLEFAWPRNVLRHSYISYRIAVVKSAEQVALEAGNSPAIIFRHYRELATEEQATAWFNIRPQENGTGA